MLVFFSRKTGVDAERGDLVLCNYWPSQVDRIKEPQNIWRCHDVVLLIFLLWTLTISHLLANASHLLIPSSDVLSLKLPFCPKEYCTQFPYFLFCLFEGSTCRTGSPRTSIYNRLSTATIWHHVQARQDALPRWIMLKAQRKRVTKTKNRRLQCFFPTLFVLF